MGRKDENRKKGIQFSAAEGKELLQSRELIPVQEGGPVFGTVGFSKGLCVNRKPYNPTTTFRRVF